MPGYPQAIQEYQIKSLPSWSLYSCKKKKGKKKKGLEGDNYFGKKNKSKEV